ncbi:hypothetical protein [Celerinatantimonas sp. YJH-8]|uniref:hypothetical protein n=1 Tax=Celerinatantimonas sp. YJH-8 TaxID=3228714 RepID=UPI0038C12FAF
MQLIDWQKLQFQFGNSQKLTFWIDQICDQSEHELALLQQARQDYQLKIQVVGIFTGIASLLMFSPLEHTCQWLQHSDERNYTQGLEHLEQCYCELLEQLRNYRQSNLTHI